MANEPNLNKQKHTITYVCLQEGIRHQALADLFEALL